MTIPFPKSSGADCSAHKHPRRWLREAGESPNFTLHFRTVSTGLPVQAAGLRHFSAGSPSFRPKPRFSAFLIHAAALFCCLFFPLAVGPETCYTCCSVEGYLQKVSHVWKRFSIPCNFFPVKSFVSIVRIYPGFFMHLGRQAQPMQGPRLSIDSHCTSE